MRDTADNARKEIVGLTPEQVRWFTPSYYKDGRQRAQLFGDSSQGGAWVDRVKIPSGMRALAHTHPHFVAAKDGAVIVQLSSTGKFGTEYLEK